MTTTSPDGDHDTLSATSSHAGRHSYCSSSRADSEILKHECNIENELWGDDDDDDDDDDDFDDDLLDSFNQDDMDQIYAKPPDAAENRCIIDNMPSSPADPYWEACLQEMDERSKNSRSSRSSRRSHASGSTCTSGILSIKSLGSFFVSSMNSKFYKNQKADKELIKELESMEKKSKKEAKASKDKNKEEDNKKSGKEKKKDKKKWFFFGKSKSTKSIQGSSAHTARESVTEEHTSFRSTEDTDNIMMSVMAANNSSCHEKNLAHQQRSRGSKTKKTHEKQGGVAQEENHTSIGSTHEAATSSPRPRQHQRSNSKRIREQQGQRAIEDHTPSSPNTTNKTDVIRKNAMIGEKSKHHQAATPSPRNTTKRSNSQKNLHRKQKGQQDHNTMSLLFRNSTDHAVDYIRAKNKRSSKSTRTRPARRSSI